MSLPQRIAPPPMLGDRATELLSSGEGVPTSDSNVVEFPQAREKSLFKTIGLMALQGLSRSEIAETLGEPQELIDRVWNTPQVQELFKREIAARGKFAVKQLLAGAATDAVVVMIDVLHSRPSSQMETGHLRLRLNAANAILDRAYGKPTQSVRVGGDNDLGDGDAATELAKVQLQINAIMEKRKKLG